MNRKSLSSKPPCGLTAGASERSTLRFFVIALIAAGTLLRVLFIMQIPLGLNQDEASSGYEAWALLNYGIDRNGDSWPVLLTSWGSGQNVLYSIIAIPFTAIFGLSVFSTRLPAALLGSLALVFAYLLGKRAAGEKFAFLLTLSLVISPWHFSISRWALESNILPFFILLAVYGAVKWDSGAKGAHILTAAALGLSLYAYGTAFIWAPLFALGIAVRMLIISKSKTRTLIQIGIAFAVFAIIALPISICNARNILGLPEMKLLWFTLPQLTETRQASTMSLDVLGNFKRLIEILWTQNDGLVWNSVPGFGLFYGPIGIIVFAVGTITAIVKKRGAISLIALAAAFVTALFVNANINRVNVLLIPIVYFQAEGLYYLAGKIKNGFSIIAPAMIVIGAAFIFIYFTSYKEMLSLYFQDRSNMPYIYVLFEEKVPPNDFADSVEYINPDDAFRWPSSFYWYDSNGGYNEWRY